MLCLDNRARLAVLGICLIFITRTFSNWPYFLQLFVKGDKMRYLCTDEVVGVTSEANTTACSAQKQALQDVFSIISGCELVGGILAGMLIDCFGNVLTAVIGILMQAVSIIMLVLDSENASMLRLAGVGLGLSINCVGTPALGICRLYPKNQALCTAYILAAQCVAAGVLPMMSAVSTAMPALTLNTLLFLYLVFILAPCGVAYLFVLPADAKGASARPEEEYVRLVNKSPGEELSFTGGTPVNSLSTTADTRRISANVCIRSSSTLSEAADRIGAQSISLIRILRSDIFLVFSEVLLVAMICVSYFNIAMTELIGQDNTRIVGVMLPLQSVFILIWGILNDHFSTPTVMGMHFIGYSIMYLLTLTQLPLSRLFAGLLFLLLQPYSYVFKFSYVMHIWSKEFHYFLFGILGGVSGLTTIILGLAAHSSTEHAGACSLAVRST